MRGVKTQHLAENLDPGEPGEVTQHFGDLCRDVQKLNADLQRYTGIVNQLRKMAAEAFRYSDEILALLDSTPLVRQLPNALEIKRSARELRALVAVNVMYFHKHYHPPMDDEKRVVEDVRRELGQEESEDMYRGILDQLIAELALQALGGRDEP